MSKQRSVYIRFNGWIELLPIESEHDGVLKTARNQRGFEAECQPGGSANVQRWCGETKIFDGLGAWNDTEIKIQTGIKITIPRKAKIWSMSSNRYRILDRALTIYNAEEGDEGDYIFKHEGSVWSIGAEDVT